MENHLINLAFLGLVKISGYDKVIFLHNLLSNDIKNLQVGQACYATFNNNKGRIIANLLIIPKQEYILLVLSKDLIDYFIQKLKLFVLRSKVCIQDISTSYKIVGKLPKINNDNLILNQLKFDVIFTENNLIIHLPNNANILIYHEFDLKNISPPDIWKSYEIDLGFVWINTATSEKFVAQMLNQQKLGLINFKKGCYPGQEIIARTQYLGKIKRFPIVCESEFKIHDGEKIFDHKQQEIGLIVYSCKQQQNFKYLAVVNSTIETTENKLHTKQQYILVVKKILFNEE